MPRVLTAGGRRLEYERLGPRPPGAPTLVFLHAGLGCAAMWRDFAAALATATECGAVVYSRAGYGGSDPADLPRPASFMHDEATGPLEEVLAALGIDDAILVGHSDGASIALIHAGGPGRDRRRIRGLVLEAPHVFVEPVTLASIAGLRTRFAAGDLRRSLARHHGPNTDHAFHGWTEVWLRPDFVDWNIEEYLPAVACPVLVLQGEDDAYGTLRQVEAIRAGAAGPVESIVVAGCGHSVHRDRLELSLEVMARFVRRLL